MSYDKQKKNRDEEKVFSVTMTEEELRLFSEFLEQREYARGNVSGMNPNMVRRRVIHGKTVTRTAPGKGPSTKQVRERESRSWVDRDRPKTEYVASENGRTVESQKSIDRKKEFDSQYNKRLINQKKSQRTGDKEGVGFGIGRSLGTVFNDGSIHSVISSKAGIVKGMKDIGLRDRYSRDSADVFQVQRHEGRHISPKKHKDHTYNLSDGRRADGSPVLLRDFYKDNN